MIKVSIIIPVFNTEEFLEEAIRSILSQTLQEIEVIVINDGSTDHSAEVIRRMAALDSRIISISQVNKGLSATRNKGVEKAKGEYIYFMDSDDILEENALELCYKKCVDKDLDFVFFDAEVFGLTLPFDYKRTQVLKDGVYSGLELLDIMLNKRVYRSSVCLNLIKREHVKSNNLTFLPGIIHEDELYSFLLYSSAKRVSFIPQSFYKRRVREDSIMTRRFSLHNITSYFTVLKLINKERNNSNQSVVDKLISYIVNPVIYNAASLNSLERLHVLQTCIKQGYIRHIRVKNLSVLVFPWLINIKSLFKKRK